MKTSANLALLVLLFVPSVTAAAEADGRQLFERLKELEGKWRIVEPASDTDVQFRVMAGGSAVVETWEMSPTRTSMTVYVLDDDRLLMTHYCPQGNAPRLVYTKTDDKNVHHFEFLDGTNLQDKTRSHQHTSWLSFDSKSKFTRSETYVKNGQELDTAQAPASPQVFIRANTPANQ